MAEPTAVIGKAIAEVMKQLASKAASKSKRAIGIEIINETSNVSLRKKQDYFYVGNHSSDSLLTGEEIIPKSKTAFSVENRDTIIRLRGVCGCISFYLYVNGKRDEEKELVIAFCNPESGSNGATAGFYDVGNNLKDIYNNDFEPNVRGYEEFKCKDYLDLNIDISQGTGFISNNVYTLRNI